MKLSDYDYNLPERLIAQSPAQHREASRLLYLSRSDGRLLDYSFSELSGLLKPADLLVFNDTKVVPARLIGKKDSGGKVEVFLEQIVDDKHFLALLKSSKKLKPGAIININESQQIQFQSREHDFFRFEYKGEGPVLSLFEDYGQVPLPPYIKREVSQADKDRYQTVYARVPGAVAAPTAGLHFSDQLLAEIKQQGVDIGFLTLHVGSGTFKPVRVEDLEAHKMHCERFEISSKLVEQIAATQARQGRVIAVGTTVARALESVMLGGTLRPIKSETQLFIRTGYQFQLINGLITNFHLPKSTLLMLVSAFAGHDQVMQAYQHAVKHEYRFFSYGDAMFIA